jgi:hypothetical protein
MLRSITATQLYELHDYAQIEPFGEERMDLRFAFLAAALVGAAGGKALNGGPYTADIFLRALQSVGNEQKPVEKRPPQSIEYMEALLKSWTDSSNQQLKEERHQHRMNRS